MNDHLRKALDALESGAADLAAHSTRPLSEVRARLRQTADQILTHLEAEDEGTRSPEDVMGRLERQSRDIGEELRRLDELMKRRLHGE